MHESARYSKTIEFAGTRNTRPSTASVLTTAAFSQTTIISLKEFTPTWKPKCPCCGNMLTIVYDDVPQGHLNVKCFRCRKTSLVDMAKMEVHIIGEPA